jgi:DNA-binding IclR family transcriptional regulator
VASLVEELEATRKRGYGQALEEAEEGVAAVAVTIGDQRGVVGTMSVAAPIGRLGPARIDEILPELKQAAKSMMLAWHAPAPGTSDAAETQNGQLA